MTVMECTRRQTSPSPFDFDDDDTLLSRARDGDMESADTITRRYLDRADKYVWCRTRAFGLDREEVRSLAGMAIARAIANYRYKPGLSFRTRLVGAVSDTLYPYRGSLLRRAKLNERIRESSEAEVAEVWGDAAPGTSGWHSAAAEEGRIAREILSVWESRGGRAAKLATVIRLNFGIGCDRLTRAEAGRVMGFTRQRTDALLRESLRRFAADFLSRCPSFPPRYCPE